MIRNITFTIDRAQTDQYFKFFFFIDNRLIWMCITIQKKICHYFGFITTLNNKSVLFQKRSTLFKLETIVSTSSFGLVRIRITNKEIKITHKYWPVVI